jgi:hypothetical protein
VSAVVRLSGGAAALGLAGIAGLHAAWGFGSSFPFGDRAALADAVVGRRRFPGSAACHSVALALFTASALTVGVPAVPSRAQRAGRAIVATVLISRGALGVVGRTDLVSPGSTSPRFRRLDRAVYAPLCLTLGSMVATTVPDPHR